MHNLSFVLSFHPAVSSVKVSCVLWCRSLAVPDAELNGAPENAFVTLNPCSVSVDDIIV